MLSNTRLARVLFRREQGSDARKVEAVRCSSRRRRGGCTGGRSHITRGYHDHEPAGAGERYIDHVRTRWAPATTFGSWPTSPAARGWESTSWTTGGVTRCVNHNDRDDDGSQTVDLKYEYEANAAIKAAESPDPGEHPRPGQGRAQRARVHAAARRPLDPAGRPLHERQLLREQPREPEHHPHDQCSRHERAAHRSVPGAEGRRRPRRVGIDRERRTTGQGRDESSRPGSSRHGRQDGRLQVLDNGQYEPNRPVSEHHSNVHQRPAHDVPEQLPARGDHELGCRTAPSNHRDGRRPGWHPASRPA